ncbi:hypothetical protein GJ496_009435 [Pomphorhynchus laevis]|nr:hypothetical protein GJ496_009435 [Pomphorhynchus laevis]
MIAINGIFTTVAQNGNPINCYFNEKCFETMTSVKISIFCVLVVYLKLAIKNNSTTTTDTIITRVNVYTDIVDPISPSLPIAEVYAGVVNELSSFGTDYYQDIDLDVKQTDTRQFASIVNAAITTFLNDPIRKPKSLRKLVNPS